MDPLQAKVAALAREWAQHCRRIWFSSNVADYLNDPAYLQLAALGLEAVPYIMELYQIDELPWEFVLQEITGICMIEDANAYSPAETKRRWFEWWTQQPHDGNGAPYAQRPASSS